jgi:hypothetical protein
VRSLGLLLVGTVISRVAAAAPVADVIVVWAPGADRAPIAAAGRELGAAVVDRSPALAAPTLAPLVQTGVEAYDALRSDAAWTAFEQARDAADKTGAPGLTSALLSDLFLYRGLIRVQREDPTGAWEELVISTVVDPTRVLDPARFPPKVIEQVARARAEVLARPRSTLAIEAPVGCTIWLDGRISELRTPQLVGPHWVRAECKDHAPWGARVDVTDGGTKIAARVVPLVPPSEADVLIQARTAGARAVIVAEVHGGIGSVRLIGIDGRERDRRTVAIAGDLTPLADAIRAMSRPIALPPHHWYQSRWTWAAGAAAIVAIIAIPITAVVAGDNNPSSGVVRVHLP